MSAIRYRILLAIVFLCSIASSAIAQTPVVGGKAPDFTLQTPSGESIRLSSLLEKGDVALVVLRGYPGYQCPYCQRQVHDLVRDADKFAAHGIQLLLVYPGLAAQLDKRAEEFLGKGEPLPANFHLVVDPDFQVTNQYGLRWNAPGETAYPSTFLLDRNGTVLFRKISHSHGDRATTEEILSDSNKTKP